MYCNNCGNQVTVKTTTCPYCEKPLPTSTAGAKSLRSCIVTVFAIITVAAFAIALYFAFPEFWRYLLSRPTKEEPKPTKLERTAESDKAAVTALYKRYLEVLYENPEPEKFRKFVQKKRLNELSEGGSKSLIFDQLVPDLALSGIEVNRVIVEGDRAIIVTQVGGADKVTDDKGNPLGATGIAKLIYEDDGWKIFSQVWHFAPPTDPVEDAMPWLSSSADNEAASELVSLGVEYGDEACLDAISRSRSEIVKLCLKAGFRPDTPGMGQTAFDIAVSNMLKDSEENLEIIKAMLAAGADVDSRTGGALTPLMQASVYCKPEFADVFIQAGANVNFKNEQGLTPLGLAQNCPEVRELLQRHGAK